jgi:hypothetical protein
MVCKYNQSRNRRASISSTPDKKLSHIDENAWNEDNMAAMHKAYNKKFGKAKGDEAYAKSRETAEAFLRLIFLSYLVFAYLIYICLSSVLP